MPASIISNKKNLSTVLHFNSNATLVIAGNNSVSNVAIGTEVLSGASITQIAWGCDGNGHIQVFRGANLQLVVDSTSYIDFAGNGMDLELWPTANLTVNFVGSANGYCVIELQKNVANTTSDYFVT